MVSKLRVIIGGLIMIIGAYYLIQYQPMPMGLIPDYTYTSINMISLIIPVFICLIGLFISGLYKKENDKKES
jgi:uncharacterized membrane protein